MNSPSSFSSDPSGETGVASSDAFVSDVKWWQSVRVRFGLLLGLALLPWLFLTGIDSWKALDRDRLSQSQLADIMASTTVRDVGQTLQAGRLGLEAAPLLISERGCDLGSAEVLARLPVYSALIVEESAADPTCQRPPSIDQLQLIEPDPFDDERDFRIERGILEIDDQSSDVIVLQSIVRSTGDTYTLVMPASLGVQLTMDSALGFDSDIALAKADGRPITGASLGADARQRIRERSDDETELFYRTEREDDVPQRAISQYFDDIGVFVTVARDVDPTFFDSLDNPYTTFLLPILVWVVGFVLIWLGTHTMLIRPIRKIRLTARQFARGKMNNRVELTGAAAAEIYGLAESFNQMADELQDRSQKIADNLDEKDTLMREIHHRVKNNLQIIISLLNMQERKADNAAAIEAISETRTRINAISIVHRGLYESADLRRIDVAPFMQRLVASIGDSLSVDDEDIILTQNVCECQLSADDAIPVALFTVEAITNAVLHGVDRGGKINVEIDFAEEGVLRVDVSDDGKGVGDPQSMRGVGSRLMKGFSRQLSGTLTFKDNSPGLLARLEFPHEITDEQPFQVSRRNL